MKKSIALFGFLISLAICFTGCQNQSKKITDEKSVYDTQIRDLIS